MSRAAAFPTLGRAGQTRRLGRLAAAALAEYPIEPVRVRRLREGWNAGFAVTAADGGRWVLRVHRPDGPSRPQIEAELEWLAALDRDTDLLAPVPLRTPDGRLGVEVAVPGVPEPRTCDLLRWIDGRFLDASLTPDRLRAVGEYTARLQRHAADHGIDADRRRHPVGVVGVGDRTADLSAETGDRAAALLADLHLDGAVLIDVVAGAREADAAVGDARGLQHSDLHQWNYLFVGDRIGAIDFDDTGWGPYVYDLAVTLSELHDRDDRPALRAALFDGYRDHQPLPVAHEEAVEAFVTLRHAQLMLYAVEHRDEPQFRSCWYEDAVGVLALLRRGVG